ncbi:Alpha/beta hydrolase family protein [Planctomycetes bacterium CA13]|uniref:Alpha/beta hydrolase family protein n=1 Tax=Novipirellula herctigrandis TaxID=2527986 RepID=A0A5C5Z4H3_9BACT|nr:Alpha/beta hydrolase family protein [Planctomycetes bacterium CA13]
MLFPHSHRTRNLHTISVTCLGLLIVTFSGCLPTTPIEPFSVESVSLPEMPSRPTGKAMAGSTALRFNVSLPVELGQPGEASQVVVLMPSKKPQLKLPCLVYTPAGSPLFAGMQLTQQDEMQMLPYVQMGFAVVCYETDGGAQALTPQTPPKEMAELARKYVASKAGLVNARNAITWALRCFEEIDKTKMYAIGHSSGGKQALLLAAHDTRIRGCVAFAPACKMDSSIGRLIRSWPVEDPDQLVTEVRRSVPMSHSDRIQVPCLLIHSHNDRIVRSSEVQRMGQAIGSESEITEVDSEDHFDIPQVGFVTAAKWLQKHTGLESDDSIDPIRPVSLPAKSPTPVRRTNVRHNSGDVQYNPYLQ